MTQPEKSDTLPGPAELEEFYCCIEYDFAGSMMISQPMAQWAKNAREAAERCAGFQLGTQCHPRRIRVYRGKPIDFEWRKVDQYTWTVGDQWQ